MSPIRFLWRPALWLYAGSVIAALPFALLAGSLAYQAYGGHPRGDAVLYDRDMGVLFEWVARDRALLMPVAIALATTLTLAEYGRLFSVGATIVSVNQHDGQSPYTFGQALARIAPYLARLARWVTAVRVLQLVAIGLSWLACQGIRGHASTPTRDLLCLVPVGIAAFIVSFLGVAHDCARTQLVAGEARPWASLLTKTRWPLRAWLYWLLWASVSALLILFGWGVNQVSARWIMVAWLLHQALHFARSAVFVGWLWHLRSQRAAGDLAV